MDFLKNIWTYSVIFHMKKSAAKKLRGIQGLRIKFNFKIFLLQLNEFFQKYTYVTVELNELCQKYTYVTLELNGTFEKYTYLSL